MKVRLLSVVLATASLLAGCGGGMEATIDAAEVAVSPQEVEVGAEPLGSVTSTGIYLTPAQVRTRYGFDALPNTPAAKGSGQLIAVISTYHNPDLAANLAAFSAKYNLPQCTEVKTVYTKPSGGYAQANISHPMPGAPCTIQVVNVDSFGRATTVVPTSGAATASWMMEASMDIEWAHAMAPGASILVVQAPSIFVGALGNAAKYASVTAKADVVSMSWGIDESTQQCTRKPGQPTVKYDPKCNDEDVAAKYWQSVNSMFVGNATFVAASGDKGVLQWPAISPSVLAVGGTNAYGAADTGWKFSGGGVSKSFPAAIWQKHVTGNSYRNVPDVAYDAGTPIAVYVKPNASTGYPDSTCVKSNGAANCGWYGGGGTSAGAPQWAGIVAITNAMRETQGKSSMNFASALYSDVAMLPGNYVTMFSDIKSGSSTYNTAKDGYDTLTGLGVPNTSSLVTYLASR